MSEKSPWWFSEGEAESKGFDLGGIATGAQLVVDWARESLLTTHQGHVNPADNPQCLICRAVQLFHSAGGAEETTEEQAFFWVELDAPRD